MLMTAISVFTTLALTTPPENTRLVSEQSDTRVAQTYEYDTQGDRVNVKYKPRGWFMYYPTYPVPEDYEPRAQYPETRDNAEQESFLERRDSPAQEKYLEPREDAAQEEYLSPRGDR